MNVIIANERQKELESLDIEIIKSINGVYSADELVSMFSNFFFGRMVLDLTAIKDFKDITNLQKFALSLDVEKMIVLLPDTPECLTPSFLSSIISIGIYNFTTNLDGVKYLLNNPNTYRDVAHLHQINQQQQQLERMQAESGNSETKIINPDTNSLVTREQFILGIKNITDHSGATMLSYMIKNYLKSKGKSCVALEVEKRDFTFLNDKEMITTTKDQIATQILKNRDIDVIIVDLNRDGDETICNDVLYLLEPSTIKLNKVMMINQNTFKNLGAKKIVINQNVLSNDDIRELEFEAGFKAFFVLPPLDERKDNSEILSDLLVRLGI